MDSERWQRVEQLFHSALERPPNDRKAFLANACERDGDLQHQVEILLAQSGPTEALVDKRAWRAATDLMHNGTILEAGVRLGPYEIADLLGHGGMGTVYRAIDTRLNRVVAIKVSAEQFSTRFEREARAVSALNHPNICTLHDVGPNFLVMELIEGETLAEWLVRAGSLPIRDALEISLQVAEALEVAHSKGIIHCDLKPSNIKVTPDGRVKVLDFGLARAIRDAHTEGNDSTEGEGTTQVSGPGQVWGTPAYMSPEQAALTSADVDTRTDIYSLGVLLYELLTGGTPFDARELLKAGIDEVRRVVREEQPPRPSTRLITMRRTDLGEVCQHRHAEPPALIRQLRGDLDWIVMMALEKDRARRYKTAHGLALDVRRFLSGETILARPPSKFYRFQKLVLRNRLLFAGTGAVAALLVTGVIVLSAALAQEREARQQAVKDKQRAEQVVNFVEQLADNNENIISTLRHLSEMIEADGNSTESEKLRSQALALLRKPGPGNDLVSSNELGSLLALEAGVEARRGRWEEAATDAARSLEYQPSSSFRYSMVAALYLKTGNRSAYEQFCKKLFLQYRDTGNIFFADQVAKACLFLPASEVDLNVVGHLADTAVTLGAKDEGAMPFFSVCKGLAEYRLGHFANAAEWAQKALSSSRKDAYPHAYGVLALADWRLGKKEEARAMLAAGQKAAPRTMPPAVIEDPGTAWLVWLFARIQLDEAEAVINPALRTTNEPNSQSQER